MDKLFKHSLPVLSGCITVKHNDEKKFSTGHSVAVLLMILLTSTYCKSQSMVQLAPPLIKYQSVFFKNETSVELKFAQKGTQIHYTLDNQLPTKKDKIYKQPIQINKSFTTLKAMVFGDGFLPSEMISATFIKDGLKIKSVTQSPANKKFQGKGENTLIDNMGGLTDLNSGTWLGYLGDSAEVNLLLEGKQEIAAVLVNCLQDYGSWILLPEQIRVYYFDETAQSFQLIAEQKPVNTNLSGASCQPILIKLSKKINAQKMKIMLTGIKSLPEGHPGKGQPGWIFIDEIKLY